MWQVWALYKILQQVGAESIKEESVPKSAGSRFESRQHANMRDTEEYESDQEHVLSLQAGIQPDLYAFSVCRGPSDKDKVLVLVDRVPLRMLPDTPATPKYAYSEQFFNR